MIQTERSLASINLIEMLPDHLQRKVVLALDREHVTQPLHVTLVIAAISRRRTLRCDQSFGFQKSDLGNRDLGEFGAQHCEDLPDASRRRT
jgi:hypothetical protein